MYMFFVGMLGAFVVYFCIYRERRIMLFLKEPKRHWRVFIFDLLGYLICGGLVTIFLVEPTTSKEAFMGGCTWEGLVGGTMAGIELKIQNTIKQEG